MTKCVADPKPDDKAEPGDFERFENLTKGLLKVSKKDLDAEREREKAKKP